MLTIVATPIGNLEDITLRALKALENCDFVLAEDTRKSKILLSHYKILKPLVSFHKFNEKTREASLLKDLEAGKNIVLISDAGTPLISDPGFSFVQKIIQNKIPFTHLPGPSSFLCALVLSGFDMSRFQFVGFLPKKKKKQQLIKMLYFSGTSIAFESPHRIQDTLQLIAEIAPKRTIAIARELTKIYEECLRGNALDLIDHFEKKEPRGEMVLLIEKGQNNFDISLSDLLEILQEEMGLSLKEAIKEAAIILKKPKKEVYQHALDHPRSKR